MPLTHTFYFIKCKAWQLVKTINPCVTIMSRPPADLDGLHCVHYIHALQSEAHQALNEYVKMLHREDHARFIKLFIALSMLRSINANVVAEIFFKPVIGTVNMEEVLLEMFYGK